MNALLPIALLVFQATQLLAAEATRVYEIQRTAKPPKIDGLLTDDVWNNIALSGEFIQTLPIEGARASQLSEVRLLYDNSALYVSARLHDNHPDSILHELGSRDDQNLNTDYFRIGIDPYNLRQDGFVFEVTAAGVQGDSKISDPTFNAVWESAAQMDAEGWTVEIKIPYSAIRFPKKPVQEWGLQFVRYVRRNREYDQWALVPAGNNNPLIFWGTLKGIEKVESPVRLSITPYASFYLERSPDYQSETSYTYSNSTSYNFGADLKYGLDDRFTLDMTLLPDFGQVQSDNKIKNLSYQEVTYDENRSFFKEGTDLFSKNGLFYSRRIGKTPDLFSSVPYLIQSGETIVDNPSQVKLLNATKLSGRTDGGLGIGVFNAITDNTYAKIKSKEGNEYSILTEPLTNYNVFVMDQQLKNNSNIFFINTNVIRDKKQDDANVTGTGFTFSNAQNSWAVDGNANLSQIFTAGSDGNTYSDLIGYKYFYGARKTSGTFQFGASRTVANESYQQNDLGYYTINDYEYNRGYFQYFQFKPAKVFRESNQVLTVDYRVNHTTGERTGFQVSYDAFASFLSYHSIFGGGGLAPSINYDYNEPRIPGRYSQTIKFYYLYAGFSSDYRKALAADFTFNTSNFIGRFEGQGYNTDLTLRYRFSDKFTMSYTNRFSYDPFNFGAMDWFSFPDTVYYGLRILHTYENILSGKYIFKNDMSLTLNARHYWITGEYRNYLYLEADGDVTDKPDFFNSNPHAYNFNYNVFNIDLVYSWQFAPGSFMTLVYKNAIETNSSKITNNLLNDLKTTLHGPQTNSVSLKLIYYLDYLYLRKKS